MTRVYTAAADWSPDEPGPVVAIGNFDGVHAGHRAVLAQLTARARSLGAPTCVLTFEPAPTAVLAPARHQPRILLVDERVRRLADFGVDIVIVEPFDRAFAEHTAEWFARQLLGRTLHARGVVVGYDFRFGSGRTGDAAALRAWLPGVPVDEVAAHSVGGEPVSSSRIRRLVAAGDVEGAAALLGRPHFLQGRVVHGDHRGRTIGFPTANLDNQVELLPAPGVYAVRATVQGVTHLGVTNIGIRPTFDGVDTRVETHLLDFEGDLYGQDLRVDIVARIREERRFPGVDALIAQIRADAAAARERLA